MKLGIFLLKITIIMGIIIIVIISTAVRPHKHDHQAGGHGPALFWPLNLRRFRVHILPTYTIIVLFTVFHGTFELEYFGDFSTFPEQWW